MKTIKCKFCGSRFTVSVLRDTHCFSCEYIDSMLQAISQGLGVYPNKKSVKAWQTKIESILLI